MKKEKELPKGKAERMEFIYRSLSNGIRAAKSLAPREWLKSKGLSIDLTGACFNSGQMHHRKEEGYKMALVEVGFMQESKVGGHTDKTYTVFGIFSIMFPLRNLNNEIVNFYSIRIRSENTAYMNQEGGLYPGYPSELTKRLFVVNTVLEAATILESKILDNKEAVIALNEGVLTEEHKAAIKRLVNLQEVIHLDSPVVKTMKENKIWDRKKK
ncbi:MAG: hypothetical protein ACJ77K_06550 [Bacteroidia bacterium]